jgi:hypothetical protein
MRIAVAVLLLVTGCAWWGGDGRPAQLVLGSSDQGCTASPDIAGGHPCRRHDSAYWSGGTEQDRFAADAELLFDLALWGVPEEVATVYYRAVRQFGASHWHYTRSRTRGPRED